MISQATTAAATSTAGVGVGYAVNAVLMYWLGQYLHFAPPPADVQTAQVVILGAAIGYFFHQRVTAEPARPLPLAPPPPSQGVKT